MTAIFFSHAFLGARTIKAVRWFSQQILANPDHRPFSFLWFSGVRITGWFKNSHNRLQPARIFLQI